MFRAWTSRTWILRVLALLAGLPAAFGVGFENFNNFPVTGSTYADGTFLGQDGSTWTYVQCRGNKVINAPTPGLNKGSLPAASVASGAIANGCGTLSFDWMQLFTGAVNLDIVVNGTVRHTVTGGIQNVTNHAGPLAVNVGGNFTLTFQQHDAQAGQVAIDNVAWTSYGGAAPEPPTLVFAPDTNGVVTAYGKAVQLTVTATEPNLDAVTLWATDLPPGATFNAATGTAPVIAAFAWTPASAQTGQYAVVFHAGDKDGTNSRPFSIEVTPVYPYYHYAEGLTGTALKAKLHEIVSAGAVQLTDDQENEALKALHTDPANTNNVLLLYNPTSSVPKSAYNAATGGWNKEHCWPESRGLGSDGPDQNDVHNLYAEDKAVNALRGNLYFDESDPADPGYLDPVAAAAPHASRDGDSWEPPPASKGNVARAVFYMAVRYDGSEPKTSALSFADDPAFTNAMGRLATLLLWHACDPPDAAESNRNETIYGAYQHNRNPFIDRPAWAEDIWGTDADVDGVTATRELIAGTDPNNPDSVFAASLTANAGELQIGCGLLSSGSIWRLYQGAFDGSDILWEQVAQTNRLQSGTVRFQVVPTGAAGFYHLRAIRP